MELASKGLIGLGVATATITPVTVFSASKSSKKDSSSWPITLAGKRNSSNKNKYAYRFSKFFIDTSTSTNKEWWDNSFSKLTAFKKTNASDLNSSFNSVTISFGVLQGLNATCSSYYHDSYSNINNGSNGAVGTTIKNIWKFCSILEKELELVSSSTQETTTIKGKHKNVLIDAEANKNTKFWEIQNEDFFGKDGLGSYSTQGTTFHALYNNNDVTKRKTLRETCLEAYKKNASQNSTEETDTLLFCSISIVKQS